ncbi:transient receptor potential cation channel subfamily V member 5-like isoform X2 [Physella acuta]|uniref:transient receptor potential cation channel subfamily V member 5-like isoform X2 n=1 Tax=Physella acuta TaxID=109671 RepID=UPI0027DCD82E|nr:transient receptor potential cation channel subfamily V member 5-like isoform X2 [Physella acuta]
MGNLILRFKDKDDAWKQQNKEMDENPAYRFANFGKGGVLIEAYNQYGPDRVREIARNEMSKFFYFEDGKKHCITREEFFSWQRKLHCRIAGVDENQKFVEEESEKEFIPHEACWDLNKRGGVGETPFHLLYLNDSPVHFEVAKILLQLYPNLALDVYEGEEYYGESALHIAIVVGDFDSVQLLVESGANVNQRATGRFFLPEDQKKGATENTDYDGYAYFGEYPLAFAASLGNTDVYDYLLEHGADPNLQDSFGNTILHMVVIADQRDMYRYAVRHHKIKAITSIKNKQNLTPLTLACKLGRHSIFKVMLDLDSVELWRFSTTMCSVHPLNTLDSIAADGSTNWNSALMIIVNGEKEEHLEMLEGGVMRQLLIEKWKTFARQRFIMRLCFASVHLVLFSVVIYTRPSGENLLSSSSTEDAVRLASEVIVCLSCLATVVSELMEISTQGLRTFFKNLTHAPAQTVYLISCLLILACIPFRVLEMHDVEDMLLILAAPCTWFFLLFFARGHILTGPFVTMIYKMCAGDLFRFGIIYVIFLFGFTQDFFFLFRDVESSDNEDVKKFSNLTETVLYLFQMTFGEFKYEVFEEAHYPVLSKIIFALFMILVPILLLNMLIAMMGNTYTQVISKSTKEWWKQWAKIVIVLERGISKKKLLEYQKSYSVKLSGKPSPDEGCPPIAEERALVVIKNCEKSKAKTRKGAVHRWKLFGKEIIRQRKIWQNKNNEAQPFALSHSLTKGQLEDENLLSSTVAQLAWEKDIDLTKGHQFVTDMDSISPRSNALRSPTHFHTPYHLTNGSDGQSNHPPNQNPLKHRKQLVYNRVAPLFPPPQGETNTELSAHPNPQAELFFSSLVASGSEPVPSSSLKSSDEHQTEATINTDLPPKGNQHSSRSGDPLDLGEVEEMTPGCDPPPSKEDVKNVYAATCWTEESPPVVATRRKVKRRDKKTKYKGRKKGHSEGSGSNSSILSLIESGGSSKA